MSSFIRNVLLWIDEGANVFLVALLGLFFNIPAPAEGNAHYTVSQVLSEMRKNGSKVGCIGCAILTWIQNKIFRISGDHCTQAMDGVPENETTG